MGDREDAQRIAGGGAVTAIIIDGKAIAAQLRGQLAQRIELLRAQGGPTPTLRVLLAGDDPASRVYVRNKARVAQALGIDAQTLVFDENVSTETLLETVRGLNEDPQVHGILVQLPLPYGVDTQRVLDAVRPDKDVDGFHPLNQGYLACGRPRAVACTPAGCMYLLREAQVPIAGARAVVLGRSLIVGRPMAALLLQADATVTVAHSHTSNVPALVRQADIVIAAVGKTRLVRGDWIKPGAAVIDVGINRDPVWGLCGDVAFDEVREVAGVLSPVPGGVGPMTIAMLMNNVCRAAEGFSQASGAPSAQPPLA